MDRPYIGLLADGHLTSGDRQRLEVLRDRLVELAGRCSAIYILGDLFNVWLGIDPAPHVDHLRETLATVRARGARVVYVEGNRDFAIGSGATAGLFDLVARRSLVERFGSMTVHLSHGDLVNPRDLPYRLWRAFAKGLLAPVGLRLLPAAAAVRLATRLEQKLRDTNRRHKSSFPVDACRAFAAREVARGADLVVVGHFHHEHEIAIDAGGRRGTFLSLPFWHDEPRPVLFDGEGRRAA